MMFDFVNFTDLKQMIVICSLVVFCALILISELFFGFRCSDCIMALLNMMIGALIAILSGKSIELNGNTPNEGSKKIDV
ncbi:MAG: hypothetical protein LBD03_09735 [Methanobrevibacter sp.]|jgi:hypothetical protein|nr:hypothetical protein [Candidatus Methanovirga procula]